MEIVGKLLHEISHSEKLLDEKLLDMNGIGVMTVVGFILKFDDIRRFS